MAITTFTCSYLATKCSTCFRRAGEILSGHIHFYTPSQAQCQLADYMFRHNSKQANALPSVVLLKPGDVLYLPPLWFHSVVSITASYSVNAWTEDLNVARINDLFRMVFPYNNSQKYLNFADKVSRAIAILYQVVTRIYGNSVLQAF